MQRHAEASELVRIWESALSCRCLSRRVLLLVQQPLALQRLTHDVDKLL